MHSRRIRLHRTPRFPRIPGGLPREAERLLHVLGELGGSATTERLAERMNLPPAEVERWIELLVQRGYVQGGPGSEWPCSVALPDQDYVAARHGSEAGRCSTCACDWPCLSAASGLADVERRAATGREVLIVDESAWATMNLVDLGLVEDTGARRIHSGRPFILWRPTEGPEWAA